MATEKLSAPKPPKSKRPSFSAPKAPKVSPKDILENNEEEEIAVLRDEPAEEVSQETQVEEVVEPKVAEVKKKVSAPKIPTKPKVVESKKESGDDLDAVLDDIETEEEMEMTAPMTGGVSVVNLVIFVLLLLFGLVGWFLYLQETGKFAKMTTSDSVEEQVVDASPTEAPAQEPTPSVTQLTREEITLEVLNGSGVSGAAGKAASTIEALGYPEIEVGNTSSVDGNELYVNAEYEGQVEVLLSDLADELDISTVSGELEGSDLVGRVVLGK